MAQCSLGSARHQTARQARAYLRAWLRDRGVAPGIFELFTNARGQPMTRAGLAYVLRHHASPLPLVARRAMEAAHAELRTRCPKSKVARIDLSVDDDD